MIVPDSFRQAYYAQSATAEVIKTEVDSILRQVATRFPGTFYSSRIKGMESTFVKALLGSYEAPFEDMEDFFACTLTVPSLSSVLEVVNEISRRFVVEESERRPPNPYEFQYGDLHLLLSLQDNPLRPDKSVLGRKFELQIKTLLQSAWSQAGHDIIYKPSKISWGADRISGQMRALLELADNVLAQIEATAELLHGQSERSYSAYKSNIKRIIEIMESYWNVSELPADRRRMAIIVQKYLELAGIDAEALNTLIDEAKNAGHLVFTYLTLPPVQQVFILVYLKHSGAVKNKLNSGKHRVLVTDEMLDFFPQLREITKGKVRYTLPA